MELNAYYPLLCCHKNPTKFTESIHLKVGKPQHEEWICKYIKKKTTENTTMKQQKGKKKKPPQFVSNGKKRQMFKPSSPGACG
jgi:hypothetical protein